MRRGDLLQISLDAFARHLQSRAGHKRLISSQSLGLAAAQPVRYHLCMTDPADVTRHTLCQRIHRFVLVLERYKRNPNRREAYHILSAIDCVKEERYAEGIEAIRAAEHVEPIPDGVVLMRGLHDEITVGELRESLRKTVRATVDNPDT